MPFNSDYLPYNAAPPKLLTLADNDYREPCKFTTIGHLAVCLLCAGFFHGAAGWRHPSDSFRFIHGQLVTHHGHSTATF